MPDDRRLSTLICNGSDVDDDLRLLARRMAVFHAGAARGPAISAAAGPVGLRRRRGDWTQREPGGRFTSGNQSAR